MRAISLSGGASVPLAQSGIPGASLVPSDATDVRWSPDGDWVAYAEEGAQRLEAVSTTGEGAPHLLTSCGNDSDTQLYFSWSPNSKLIVYECEPLSGLPGETGSFATIRPDGTHATNLAKGTDLIPDPEVYIGEPQWSPDGSRILFAAETNADFLAHVYTVRPDGSHLTRRG